MRKSPVEGLKRLLLSTDGSGYSEGAVREAIGLCVASGCRLHVLCVVETNPEYESMAPQLVENEERKTKEHLESVKARALAAGIDCLTAARRGERPFELIVEEAEKRKADLIVMGRRGRTGIERLLMGSVTANVIGRSRSNVLVVPRAAAIAGRSLLVATDGSKWSEAAVAYAVKLASAWGARLSIISVVPAETLHPMEDIGLNMREKIQKEFSENELKRARQNIQAAKAIAASARLDATGVIYTGRLYEAIAEEAGKSGADLIIMGSHGRTGLKRLLMGSVTEKVVGLSECAVLVVKI